MRVHDHVVQPPVAVNDAGRDVRGAIVRQPVHDVLPIRNVGSACLSVTLGPAGNLPVHIARPLPPVAQPRTIHVDGVQISPAVDIDAADVAGLVTGERIRGFRSQDCAVQILHDIEVRADHRVIGAVGVDSRDVGKLIAHVIDDVHFSTHVVGGCGLRSGRWSTQNQVAAAVSQSVGEVRSAARELGDLR